MAQLNRIEWGGRIDEKIPFKGSEIYNLADEITRFVGVGWKGSRSDPILDFAHRDLLTCDAIYLKNLKTLLYWANKMQSDNVRTLMLSELQHV